MPDISDSSLPHFSLDECVGARLEASGAAEAFSRQYIILPNWGIRRRAGAVPYNSDYWREKEGAITISKAPERKQP